MFNGSLIFLIKIIIFTLSCFGTYYYYKEKSKQERWEALWSNPFLTQSYRNKINPYQVKEKIYFYYATEYDHENRMRNYCRIDVYSLNEQPPIQDLKEHLNYYDETLDDTDNIVENKEKDIITILSKHPSTYNSILTHSWIYNHQVSPNMFEEESIYRQSYYDKYLECLSFVKHIPHENSVFATTGVKTYIKRVKYQDIDMGNLDGYVLSIVDNPNTLVKIRSLSYIYFYDINQRLLITLRFRPKY